MGQSLFEILLSKVKTQNSAGLYSVVFFCTMTYNAWALHQKCSESLDVTWPAPDKRAVECLLLVGLPVRGWCGESRSRGHGCGALAYIVAATVTQMLCAMRSRRCYCTASKRLPTTSPTPG